MTQKLVGSEKPREWVREIACCCSDKSLLTVFGLLLLWLIFYSEFVFSPWIQGFDSITRLYHIDRTIVVLRGNPWLPGLQLILQAVSCISDTAFAYELISLLLALGAMFVFYLCVLRLLGYWCAVYSFLFFFLDFHWQWVATAPYMEGLFLLLLSLSVYSCLRDRFVLSQVFFILASFTRPELLFAAPWILVVHLLFYRSWRRSIQLCLLFIPIVLYYIALRIYLPSFDTPLAFNWQISMDLLDKLVNTFRAEVIFQGIGVLALCSLLFIARNQQIEREKQRALLLISCGLLVFYLCFVFLLPLAHNFSSGGTRPAMLLSLPACLYASVLLSSLHQRWPALMLRVFLVAASCMLTYRYVHINDMPPFTFKASMHIQGKLKEFAYGKEEPLYVCQLDPKHTPGRRVHEVHSRPLLLYFRLNGWRLNGVPCLAGEPAWQEIALSKKAALLRLYNSRGLTPEYLKELTENCQYHTAFYKGRMVFGDICF